MDDRIRGGPSENSDFQATTNMIVNLKVHRVFRVRGVQITSRAGSNESRWSFTRKRLANVNVAAERLTICLAFVSRNFQILAARARRALLVDVGVRRSSSAASGFVTDI